MLRLPFYRLLAMAFLIAATTALSACSDTAGTSSSDELENWGPHGGQQGMGGAGPAAHPGD